MCGFGALFRVAGCSLQAMSDLLPITTIAGYLGAGKTTLVNHMLRHANGLRLAVLVNEFGELPIDEDLIEAEGDDIISIAGGCICCSYGNDLTLALIKMAEMSPRPDHVVIEASGVAIPSAIVASVGLLGAFRSDGIVALADAETVRKRASDPFVGDTVTRQLGDANIILLNKIDLVAEDELDATVSWLSTQSSMAKIVPVTRGVVDTAVVLESFLDQITSPGPHHNAEAFDMHTLRFGKVESAVLLAEKLGKPEYGLMRAKGFVEDQAGVQLIQIVGNRSETTPASGGDPKGIVCLGLAESMDKQKLDALIQSCQAGGTSSSA